LHSDFFVTVGEVYLVSLESRDLNLSDHLSISDSVDLEADSGRRSDEVFRVLCYINGSASFFGIKNTDSFALLGVEHADSTIIGAREE